ncbi:MAG: Holliday junction branch migration protein RuvA [Abditibacteriota bacterium]|nr:Holliday junction branch migration protein RuvA [Abditibacteriota bacterium]
MIGYLNGKIILSKEDSIVVRTGGVGYTVYCPSSLLARTGEEVELFVTTVVREDAISLYGFETPEEQQIFDRLILVKGLGPKSAVAALSVLSCSDIINAVLTEDAAALCRIPNVGKKTAQQIILDLRDRLSDMPASAGGSGDPRLFAEAVDVLVSLGYSRSESRKAVSDTLSETGETDLSELIRLSVSRAAGR